MFAKVDAGFQVVQQLLKLPTHYSAADGTTMFNEPWPLITHITIEQGW